MTKTKPMTDEWKQKLKELIGEPEYDYSVTMGSADMNLIINFISNLLTQATSKAREEERLKHCALGNWVGEYTTRDPNNPFPLNLSITQRGK